MALTTLPNKSLSQGSMENFRNLIINGDMSIAQRGTTFSNIAHNTYYLDRYRFHKTNTTELVMNLDQSTDVPSAQGFSNSLKLTVGTAESATATNELVAIGTKIEAQNLQHLKYGTSSAETLTLSFWIKSSVTGTYTIMVFQQDASSSPDRRYYSKSFSISSANTWEKKTIQITGNQDDVIANDNGIGFDLRINLSAGSSYTSGSSNTWGNDTNTAVGQTANFSGTLSATFFLTGVQLEVGTSASDFEFLPYDVNKERCMRYCVVYGKNEPGGSNFTPFPSVAKCVGSTTNIDFQLHHPVDLRTADVSVSADLVHISDIVSQGSDISGINVRSANKSIRATNFYSTASTACTVGNIFWVMTDNDASGYIIIDAEL